MFKPLAPYQALTPGSDLWIVASDPKDFWFKKINFNLGFPFHKINEPSSINKPTLVTTQNIFPNQNVLCLPCTEDWIAGCYKHWTQLRKPSLRLFLPSLIPKNHLEQWPDFDHSQSLTYLKTKHSSLE